MELKNVPPVLFRLALCLGLLVTPCTCITSCEPAEEGTEHQINCTVPFGISYFNMFNVEWRMVNEYNTSELVAQCFSEYDCNVLRPSDVQITFEDDTSTLTIMEVSRTGPFNVETDWSCGWSGHNTTDVCAPLQVFARPTEIQCEYDGEDDGYRFLFRCVTEKVYPKARCEMQQSYDPRIRYYRSYGVYETRYNHTMVNEDPVYYRSECTMELSLYSIVYKGHYLKALVYPEVDGGRDYGVFSAIWTVTFEEFGENDTSITVTTEPPTKEPETISRDESDDNDDSTLPLALGLGIPLAIMIVVAIVLAVLLCRNEPTNGTASKSKDPPMMISGPLAENYDHMELSNQRQGSVNAGHYYQDVQGRDGQSQRNLDSRRQEDPNVESFYVNEAADKTEDPNVYEN